MGGWMDGRVDGIAVLRVCSTQCQNEILTILYLCFYCVPKQSNKLIYISSPTVRDIQWRGTAVVKEFNLNQDSNLVIMGISHLLAKN